MRDTTRSTSVLSQDPHAFHAVDNTDWLKTVAIILVAVGHFGYFFVEDSTWWSVFGRFAAPTFFFLIGYAHTRTVPFSWIWLGVILTLLDSSNNDWSWVASNILLSFALIRLARPYMQKIVQQHGWAAFALLVSAIVATLPIAGEIVDYGAEGWLWALFGLFQRMYVDGKSAIAMPDTAQNLTRSAHEMTENVRVMRLLTCLLAAAVYVWQEQGEYSFPQIPLAIVILGIGVLSLSLCRFQRAASRVQPPKAMAGVLRFISRHTLEIYAIQLAGSEIIIKLMPDLAP
jgi:peptidoglycan/LPS O-acetylase OafA/YrhL